MVKHSQTSPERKVIVAGWIDVASISAQAKAARKDDPEAAISLLEEFVATVDNHKRSKKNGGGFQKLPCGQVIHLDPQLGKYLADCLRPLIGRRKEDGKWDFPTTPEIAKALHLSGKRGKRPRTSTKSRNRTIGKEIADIVLYFKAMPVEGWPKDILENKRKWKTRMQIFGGNRPLTSYQSLKTYNPSFRGAHPTPRTEEDPALKEAIHQICAEYRVEERTALRYYNEWLSKVKKARSEVLAKAKKA